MQKGNICCLIAAESVNSAVFTKKSVIRKIVNQLTTKNKPFFLTLSQELKKVAILYVLTKGSGTSSSGKSYGQIVNGNQLPTGSKTPELFRVLENHQLWHKRYISAQVSF